MKLETKHAVMWGCSIVVGLLGVWATIKYRAAANGAPATDGGALNLGAPSISIIGGSNPSTWNLGNNQPTGPEGIGGSLNPVTLPVLTGYNTTQNSGCNSCAQSAPSDYYASTIAANAAITDAMLHQEGYTKTPGGEIVPPGYYNLSGEMGSSPQQFSTLNNNPMYTPVPANANIL